MKQITTFEQARRLLEVGVICRQTCPTIEVTYTPRLTIGDLIEWINTNSDEFIISEPLEYDNAVEAFKYREPAKGKTLWHLVIPYTELIDALVELCIKIKEQI